MVKITKHKTRKEKFFQYIKEHQWSILISLILIGLTAWWGVTGFRQIVESYAYFQVLRSNRGIIQQNENVLSQYFHPIRNWEQRTPSLKARSVLVTEYSKLEGNEKHLLEKNSQQVLPIASLSKLLMGVVVLDHYDLDHKVKISTETVQQSGSSGLLEPGQMLTVKDLLFVGLIESSNDACYALSQVKGREQFIELINEKAAQIGMHNTSFVNASGLTDSDHKTNYSSSEDLWKLIQYIIDHDKYHLLWEITSYPEFDLYMPNGVFHHTLHSTNDMLDNYDYMIGGKTGYLPDSEGSFLGVFKHPAKQNYLTVILLNSPDRFGETQRVLKWLSKSYLYLFNYGD